MARLLIIQFTRTITQFLQDQLLYLGERIIFDLWIFYNCTFKFQNKLFCQCDGCILSGVFVEQQEWFEYESGQMYSPLKTEMVQE